MLKDELGTLNPQSRLLTDPTSRRLKYVSLLVDETVPLEHVAYVVVRGISLPPRFWGRRSFIPSFIFIGKPPEEAVRSLCDCLWVEEAIDEASLCVLLQECFVKYGEWQESLYKASLGENPLDRVCSRAASLIRKPIIVYDRFYQTLYFTPTKSSGSGPGSLVTPQRVLNDPLPPQEIESIKGDREFFDLKTPYVPGSFRREFGYEQLCYNLFYRGTRVGIVTLHANERPLTDGDKALIELVGDILTPVIVNSSTQDVRAPGNLYVRLELVLKGENVPQRELAHALDELGWNVDDEYACLFIGDENLVYGKKALHEIAKAACGELDDVIYVVRDHAVVLVCNLSKSGCPQSHIAEKVLRQLGKSGRSESVGVGPRVNGIHLIRDSFILGAEAFSMGRKAASGNGVHYFDDYLAEYVSKVCSEKVSLDALCPHELLLLSAYDRRHGTQLCSFLEDYLRSGCSKSRTAERVFSHRNTVQNKLERIADIMGADLKDGDTLSRLYLGFALARSLLV